MAKFYLETYGCKLNQADSDLIKGFLKQEFIESSEREANFIVLNSCGVVEKTERKILKRADSLRKQGKKVIIAGCLPLISFERCKQSADGIIGAQNIRSISNVAKQVLKGKKLQVIKDEKLDKSKFSFFQKKADNCSVIISISEGCLGNCSFCATKMSRGNLRSFDHRFILQKIEKALCLGFKEIQLTAQDISCYGLDKGDFLLSNLLKDIIQLNGDFRIKLGMLEPYLFKKNLKELIPILKSEKIYKFFHIPLQSGDDLILKKMRRKYKKEDFLDIIDMLEKNFEDYVLATDVIVGFPGESKQAFQNTISMVKQIKPDIVNINRFSKRKGTKAFLMEDLPGATKKERSRAMSKISERIKERKNKKYLNAELKVLVVKSSKNDTFLSRSRTGKAVILEKARIGEFNNVKIIGSKPNYLVGKVLS